LKKGTIHVAQTPGQAAQACAKWTAGYLRTALDSSDQVSVALSGGSTPALLFNAWLGENLDWRRIQIFQVDERGVPPGHPDSNASMIERELLRPGGVPPENFHRILAELRASEAAVRYAEVLRTELGPAPRIDLVLCGVGADAHTASLFPGDPLVDNREGLVSATWVEKAGQWRITLLPSVLLAARCVVALAAGGNKANAFRRIFDDATPLREAPARLLRETTGELHWFLDQAAAP
jgi:6-phosphogluconolactonase